MSISYVLKQNIDGKEVKCTDYLLIGDVLEEIENKRMIGNEKNKLVLQPIGRLVIEFLIKNIPELFEYNYTRNMEKNLDQISGGNKNWYELCKECYQLLKNISRTCKKIQSFFFTFFT